MNLIFFKIFLKSIYIKDNKNKYLKFIKGTIKKFYYKIMKKH
jgi:hypothetical protein